MNAKGGRAMFLACVLLGSGVLGACQHNLFSDDDVATERKLRYYDNDSAIQTTENRKKYSEMPFGFPQGPSD